MCFAIAVPSWFIGNTIPIIGGPVSAIVLGILVTLLFPALTSKKFANGRGFEAGVKFTSKKLLQFSIILLGFEMNFYNVVTVGRQSLLVMLFTFAAAFLTVYFLGKALKLHGATTVLIGVGTSVCGASAIAAAAPVVGAKDEDISQAVSTIFLFNIIAVFIFPILGRAMHMDDTSFGMWAGTAINDTSSVVAAGASWSNVAGSNAALAFATIVKLTRTLMIVPITLALAIYTSSRRKGDSVTTGSNASTSNSASTNGSASTSDSAKAGDNKFSFVKIFPWFVIFFVAAALVNTFTGLPASVSSGLTEAGKFLIVMAMGAIGLNTNLKKLISNGARPLLLGVSCWAVVAVVSVIVQKGLLRQ